MVSIAGRAQALRQTIETELAASFAGALTPRVFRARPLLPFGIAELDRATGGGVPVGAVTELVGPGSTGKTSAAMHIAAGAMRGGKVCAWVDASDSFDPDSGAANGMLLPQLLWVRCGGEEPTEASQGRSLSTSKDAGKAGTAAFRSSCGSHPRGEEQGLDRAVSGLFQHPPAGQNAGVAGDWPDGSRTGMHSTRGRQTLGTPGAPNVPLSPLKRAPFAPRPAFRPVVRSEQVASDRQGGRKHANHAAIPPATSRLDGELRPGSFRKLRHAGRPWTRLDQALRAVDLLLGAGGFSVIVLDLGSIAPEHASRIPAATWFRFRAAAEASGAVFVLLSQVACAQSSAGLVLHFQALEFVLAGGTVMEAASYQACVARQRFGDQPAPRKQPQATWQASPYWVGPAAQPKTDGDHPRPSRVPGRHGFTVASRTRL